MRRARTTSFAESLATRLGVELSVRDRAAISQFAHDLLGETPGDVPPALREVTVLMADLRGFSALAAGSDPTTLVTQLQPFFAGMAELIHEHGGFIDKFLGDGVMALFGAPDESTEHLRDALRCAARMQGAMEALNTTYRARGLPQLYAGIGVNTGEVMSGAFGSDDYSEYTVIGDAVNLAARMEKFALRGEVLLSEACYRLAADDIEIAGTRQLRVRGQRGPVTLYALGAVTHPQRIEVPSVEMRSSPRVPVDLPLHYHPVEDQRVLPHEYEGNIINLGYGGMLAQIPRPLPDMGEITFALAPEPTATRHEDVYARALHQREIDDGFQTAFAFTSVGTHGQEAVRRYVDQMIWGA